MNTRQIKILNRLLDGFDGKFTGRKWAAINKSSPDTALRDINTLIELGVLTKTGSGERSTDIFTVNAQLILAHPGGSFRFDRNQ